MFGASTLFRSDIVRWLLFRFLFSLFCHFGYIDFFSETRIWHQKDSPRYYETQNRTQVMFEVLGIFMDKVFSPSQPVQGQETPRPHFHRHLGRRVSAVNIPVQGSSPTPAGHRCSLILISTSTASKLHSELSVNRHESRVAVPRTSNLQNPSERTSDHRCLFSSVLSHAEAAIQWPRLRLPTAWKSFWEVAEICQGPDGSAGAPSRPQCHAVQRVQRVVLAMPRPSGAAR